MKIHSQNICFLDLFLIYVLSTIKYYPTFLNIIYAFFNINTWKYNSTPEYS